ncbi:Uncharacterised protein [Cardiobacterium valvarum]|uniref:Uncharacterized protein n=1 Tax=Cardiobacterium valvarum TaxID=194702 RepID=A0A381E1X9_9GAMM|nr:Uncharacterised protein [Cardiobacterium valvarum]
MAVAHEPSVYPAWRAPKSEHCTKKSLSPLAGEGGRRPEGGNTKPGFLPLAVAHEPSVYPAWRQSVSPVFIPFGGLPRAQRLSRLAAAHEPSIYPAWRLATSPAFIPLDGPATSPAFILLGALPSPNIARKNPFPRLRGKVAEGRKGGIQNQDFSLGGCPRTQGLSRLAAVRKPSVYSA